jgi:predicted ATP-grasp superfamily ATP-dependent carboligase
MARGLGWLSIGLGVCQLMAAGRIARFLGVENHEGLVRLYGAREIANGVGLLLSDDPKPWIYGRIAGDALDLGTLGWAVETGREQGRAALAAGAVAGFTLLDVACARQLASESERVTEWDYSDRSGFPQTPQSMRGRVEAEFAAGRAEPNGYRPMLH